MKLPAAAEFASLSLVVSLLFTGCIKYKSRPLSAPVVENEYRARSIDSDGILRYVHSTGWNQWPPAVLDLNALTWIAAYYSPDLDVSRSQITIADAALRTARVRINPSLGADTGYNLNPESHELYGGSLGFTIETAGKRGYRILQAERDADSARLSFRETQWFLWSKVRSALIDYIFAERRLELLQRETDLRTEIVEMLGKRLSVGAASQPEVGVYRVELLRVEATLAAAKGDAVEKRVALATAMGIPPQAFLSNKIAYTGLDTPPTDISLPLHEVQKAGLLHRIDVRRTLVEYAAADASLKLEIARQYPDLQLTPGYNFEEGFARYTFSSIVGSLPVFNRNEGAIRAAGARRQQVEDRFRGLQSLVIGEMERALALYRSSLNAWQAESSRLARAEREREQAARRALEVGQGDRLSLAVAELETNTVALAQLDALVQVQVSLGALENSVQQPLEPGIRFPSAAEVNPRREVIH